MERPRCVLVACTLDDVGIRTQRADQQGTHTYSYDDLYRLTSVTYPGPSTTSYAFDAFGNRTSMTVAGNTTTYAYDDNDRITSVTPPSPGSWYYYPSDGLGSTMAVVDASGVVHGDGHVPESGSACSKSELDPSQACWRVLNRCRRRLLGRV